METICFTYLELFMWAVGYGFCVVFATAMNGLMQNIKEMLKDNK